MVGRSLGHDKGPAGVPESGEKANRDQNRAEVVESGKNATQEIGMLVHPAAGQNAYYFCNINDLSPCCKSQRKEIKQRDDIYTSDDPDRILTTSAISAISPRVVKTSVKSQNNAMIFTHLTTRTEYLLICNISDLSPCCKKQREESKQRDGIYTTDDPDRILATSATSAISPRVVTTSVKR